ncbi:MAG: exodeoxyribonuclease III [Hyphomicrobiaceae bacterium]|nr:exodeoxyribonuclease III [Hyphomicrobiaceae bacterium]MCC0024292.1 exodeoxyribonuclease III [Hyphomicrobiaceae bacterium]
MPLTFVTWNINSVRLRLPMVLDFLKAVKPDVLALQEIKCTNEQFPAKELAAAGYGHQVVHGQKAYHGVATISRLPLLEQTSKVLGGIDHARHVAAKVDYGRGQLTLHNFYIPAGGDIPDPEANAKFRHKLDYLTELKDWFDGAEFENGQLIAGDFNIAPHESDVWSHKQLLKVVSHTPVETEALDELLGRRPWIDLVRKHIPYDEKAYSWWSYRSPDWNAADKGRRLDHVWATGDVAVHSNGAEILRDWRGYGDKPSDHAPVVVRLD